MQLSFNDIINNDLVRHTKKTINSGENLTFFIDNSTGTNSIDKYIQTVNGIQKSSESITTINLKHEEKYQVFIRETFDKIDQIIDLDFFEMTHNNGSMIDIYSITYSSNFSSENVVGQALSQESKSGSWWEIFWKNDTKLDYLGEKHNFNTIIHEIGHTLGLGHPMNDPLNESFDSKDTIMSYNRSESGWSTWFSLTDIKALISIWGRENDLGFIDYEKNSYEYKFIQSSDNNYFIKTDIGLEHISNIYSLNFADKSLNVNEDVKSIFQLIKGIDDVTGKIYRLYNAAFARFPDKDGLKYWIEKNSTKENTYRQTASSFLISEEFQILYGKQSTNHEYINHLYLNILDRLPDSEGFNYWLGQLDNGYEDRSEVLMGFAESKENKDIFSYETSIS